MAHSKGHTYNYICFTDLIYESAVGREERVEKKIKRRLRYYNLGEYSKVRVDTIRRLRTELWIEIMLGSKSVYFDKIGTVYTEIRDFDIERMVVDFRKRYKKVSTVDMRSIIGYAVYYYYSR